MSVKEMNILILLLEKALLEHNIIMPSNQGHSLIEGFEYDNDLSVFHFHTPDDENSCCVVGYDMKRRVLISGK